MNISDSVTTTEISFTTNKRYIIKCPFFGTKKELENFLKEETEKFEKFLGKGKVLCVPSQKAEYKFIPLEEVYTWWQQPYEYNPPLKDLYFTGAKK